MIPARNQPLNGVRLLNIQDQSRHYLRQGGPKFLQTIVHYSFQHNAFLLLFFNVLLESMVLLHCLSFRRQITHNAINMPCTTTQDPCSLFNVKPLTSKHIDIPTVNFLKTAHCFHLVLRHQTEMVNGTSIS